MPLKPLPIVPIVAALITENPDEVGTDNRSIMFGRHEMMEQAISALDGQGETQEYEIKSSHPEVPNAGYLAGTNPDLLVAYDTQSKLAGTGTHNCVTCRHFVAHQLCPEWHRRGREHLLDQETVRHFSVGGCVLHDLLPGLNDGARMGNQLFDSIVETVLDEDVCVLYRGGQIVGQLDKYDLGVEDPRRRSREFEEYAAPVEPEEDGDEDWSQSLGI